MLRPTTTLGIKAKIYSQFTPRAARLDLKASGGAANKVIDMFTVIFGAALVAVTSASFWYFFATQGPGASAR